MGPRSTKDPADRHWFVAVVLPSQVFLIGNDTLVKEINVTNNITNTYAMMLQCHCFVNTRADLATERERHWTTGKPADRAKLDFWCRCAISQASCLINACLRQLTFPFLARNLVPRAFHLKP